MNKKYQDLIADRMDSIDLNNKLDQRDLFADIRKGLEGTGPDCKNAVAAISNWMKSTGKEPCDPGEIPNGPEKCLGMLVRNGELNPSKEAEDLFSKSEGKELPGLGEPSDQEINNQDLWLGIRAADFQSGQPAKSQELMGVEAVGGDDKTTPESGSGLPDLTWGPSRMIKGALTGDMEEFIKGTQQAASVCILDDSVKAHNTLFSSFLNLADPEGKEAREKEGIFGAICKTAGIDEEYQKGVSVLTKALFGDEKEQNAIQGVAERMSEIFKGTAGGLTTGGLGGVIMSQFIGQEKDKKGDKDANKEEQTEQKAPSEKEAKSPIDQLTSLLAEQLSAGAAYKKGRKKGLKPQEAGELSEVAGEGGKEAAEKNSPDESVDKAKKVKNIGMGIAAKAAQGVPVVGQALSIAIVVLDVVSDALMDAAKTGPSDQLAKATSPDAQAPSGPGQQPNDPTGAMGDTTSPAVFKKVTEKTKSGLVKKLLPAGPDIVDGAVGAVGDAAKGGIAGLFNTDKANGSGKPLQKSQTELDSPL